MKQKSSVLITIASASGLMLCQVGIMAVPALSVELAILWQLNATEMGWLGGIYFAGYMVATPLLVGATNRIDGRHVYAMAALMSAVTSVGFALFASGFWSALILRFAAGVCFAGISIVGMKLLSDRLLHVARARANALYTGAFATGSGCSFFIAGSLAKEFGWEAAFLAAGIGSLLALPTLLLIGPPLAGSEVRSDRLLPDFRPALQQPEIMRYVIAYAGNLWEVFGIRVWFVPFLAFNASLADSQSLGWEPTTIAALAVFVAVPFNLAIAELGVRFGRKFVIGTVSTSSIVICLLLGWQASGPYLLILTLLVIHGITSYGDVGAISAGVVAATTGETRVAALALYGVIGTVFGFIGPLAVGWAIDLNGDRNEPNAWLWAFAVMALGSVVSAAAMIWKPKNIPN